MRKMKTLVAALGIAGAAVLALSAPAQAYSAGHGHGGGDDVDVVECNNYNEGSIVQDLNQSIKDTTSLITGQSAEQNAAITQVNNCGIDD